MIARLLSATVATAIFAVPAFADTPEAPLFVAPEGSDAGNCLDAAQPCRSLGYALQRVGKNGRIRVQSGSYSLARPEDVFYLVSNAIDVEAEKGATLVGVPAQFTERLAERGFRVIVDAKSIDAQTAEALATTQQVVSTSTAATACIGGMAAGFPCNNVDLLAHVADRTPAARGADIWGFRDLNTGREYAIMGYSTGTAVFDVSDPENPREIGFIQGQNTTWRDMKVYQAWNAAAGRYDAYAYVTADNASDGLFIIDLTELPQRISRVNYASDFLAAHNIYLGRAEFGTGLPLTDGPPLLILAGSNVSDGRFRTYALDDPRSPSFIAAPGTPGGQPGGDRLYMHDAASMLVTDSRRDTQCVNAAGSPWCDVVFDFNEDSLDIWDVTNPADPQRLSRTPYSNTGYTHSGWWSEDKRYVFLQDELDERDRGLQTTVRAFRIDDLRSPVLAGTWSGPTSAIDHNGFARGNRYYMSNYARGLTILDITNPATPSEIGRFDSFPSSDATGFPGAWGTYPYLPSGNILISDIDSGLYVVADGTLDVMQGSLSFAAESFAGAEAQSTNITVQRNGGSAGAVTVDWELVPANGSAADVSAMSGTLSWAAGDAADKTITIPLVNDGVTEGLEQFIVRLGAPTGGASLKAPAMASLYVADPGSAPSVGFAESSIAVPERGFNTAVVVLRRGGNAAGAVSVEYAVTGGDATAGVDVTGPTSGTVNWSDGDADPKAIELAIADDGTGESDEFLEVSLSNAVGGAIGSNTTLRIDVLDGTGVNAAPNSVAGANQTVSSGARVTLSGGGSNDPDGDALTYSWTQTSGSTVTLSGADTDTATFTAPSVTSDTMLRFSLEVTDTRGLADTSTVTVTVRAPGSSSGGGGGGGVFSLWLLALLLSERMRLYDRLLAIRSR